MKRIIAALLIMLIIPIGFLNAEDKQTFDPNRDKISMASEGYLSIPARQAYYILKKRMTKATEAATFLDCIEGQQRSISYDRMRTGNEEKKPYQGYHGAFWVTIQCGK
jgi:hypothetical protein